MRNPSLVFFIEVKMAKRFTDSRKWYDDWFLEIPNEHKLLWFYLLDMCDHAGIFKPNMRLLNFCLNSTYKVDDLIKIFPDRLRLLDDGKFFIPKFISFQYGELKNESYFHRKLIAYLKLNKIDIPCRQGIDTLQDKDKDKDKDKDNTIISNSIYTNTFVPKKVNAYKAPSSKDKFKFIPDTKKLIKDLSKKK